MILEGLGDAVAALVKGHRSPRSLDIDDEPSYRRAPRGSLPHRSGFVSRASLIGRTAHE